MIEQERLETGIAGVWLQPLAVIPTPCGPVLHMLRKDYSLIPHFPDDFGEIYFSEINPGCIKGWKLHERQNQLFAVPQGRILIALHDCRNNSPTTGTTIALHLGRPDNYCLLSIPAGIWYGFKCLGNSPALICNCADIAHSPEEGRRLPADSEKIPFDWHTMET